MISAVVFHLLVMVMRPDGGALIRDLGPVGDQAHCLAAMRAFVDKPDVPQGTSLAGIWCVAPGTKA